MDAISTRLLPPQLSSLSLGFEWVKGGSTLSLLTLVIIASFEMLWQQPRDRSAIDHSGNWSRKQMPEKNGGLSLIRTGSATACPPSGLLSSVLPFFGPVFRQAMEFRRVDGARVGPLKHLTALELEKRLRKKRKEEKLCIGLIRCGTNMSKFLLNHNKNYEFPSQPSV
jgi:hypothetical protein